VWHWVIAALYTGAAGFGALALPRLAGNVDGWTGGLFGLVLLLGCGSIHEIINRRRAARQMARRMGILRKAYNQNKDDLSAARNEVRQIYEALERAGHMGPDPDSMGLREVAAEVKVLHSLVEQLYSDQGSDADARTRIMAPELPAAERSAAAVELASVTGEKFRTVNALDEGAILDIVRDGLRQDRIDLYLQPIVSLPQRKRRYYECFSRIRAADGTMILPEQFIDLATDNGLITAIDNMLLFRCVQLLRKTQRHDYATAFFCNVSPHTIADRDFFPEFILYLESCPDLAPCLVLELSQRDLSELPADVTADLRRLAAAGYRFSMDQVTELRFNLPSMTGLGVQFVKIDGARLLQSVIDDAALGGLTALKQTMDDAGIDLIAEKIETEKTLVELLEYHIDFGQGYLFGEPRISKDPPPAFVEDMPPSA
jgi:cyclic-di-GMP phosphodiesterase TipF (flagellum assembly factor)